MNTEFIEAKKKYRQLFLEVYAEVKEQDDEDGCILSANLGEMKVIRLFFPYNSPKQVRVTKYTAGCWEGSQVARKQLLFAEIRTNEDESFLEKVLKNWDKIG